MAKKKEVVADPTEGLDLEAEKAVENARKKGGHKGRVRCEVFENAISFELEGASISATPGNLEEIKSARRELGELQSRISSAMALLKALETVWSFDSGQEAGDEE